MKNLNHKQSVQVLTCVVEYFNNKICYSLEENNLIGFEYSLFFPQYKDDKNSLYGYSHFVYEDNKKLHKKYPKDVLKKNYKKWLKDNK